MTRPIQPQYACLCGTRSDDPGVCCGGAMYLVGRKGTVRNLSAMGNVK